MVKILGVLVCLGFLISCSSQPTSEQTTAETSCDLGNCSRNMERLAGPLNEQPTKKQTTKPTHAHKKQHSKKK